ncbi:hypothetical protein STRCR_0626 [Streptococcus criceti HS-6]|uniref:Uncharacterized protein n=1 Tax=Streptococcus criceti HS-6 TaxID=873449 RepID=G5JQW1_STRCG|nr:hypothetical protein STRCR_0626 [Streptococcus criceti HS-6]
MNCSGERLLGKADKSFSQPLRLANKIAQINKAETKVLSLILSIEISLY